MFYTSVRRPETHLGLARVAHPRDRTWTTWDKGDVVARPPQGVDAIAVRDPYVLHDGTSWLMLLGAGLSDGTATALTYRSDDLSRWRYTGLLAERHLSRTDPWTGRMWECPQLFQVDGRWVLLVSAWNPGGPVHEAYALGDLVDGRFVAETWQPLTYGDVHYAGAAFTDDAGRPGLIHWLRGVADPAGRWVGAHSLPHTLRVQEGRLVPRPHEAVTGTRRDLGRLGDSATALPGVVDLEWAVDGRDGAAQVRLADRAGELLRLAVSAGSLSAHVGGEVRRMPVAGADPRRPDRVRIVVDGAIVEIFTVAGMMGLVLPRAAATLLSSVSGPGTVTAYRLA